MQTSQNNKRIAKNTLFLYIRMGITMLVQLYTSRVVLAALGIDDYGIYNIVGSVIVAFSFVSSPLSSATQRFYNFELGSGNKDGVNVIFNHSVVIYTILSVILFAIIEIAGLWFINNKMQMPSVRIDAVLWTFHLSVFTFITGLLKVPYESLIIAHEKMSFYAYISIAEVVLKLLNAYSLIYISLDKLKLYAVNQLIIAIIILLCVIIYSHRQFVYIRVRRMWNRSVFGQLLTFSGWSLFGATASMSANQGLNILLNMFYGVAVNAAMGIANQVSAAVNQFVTNFQVAFRPQIVKSYAAGNIADVRRLISKTSKYSFLLLFAFVCPLCFNIDFVLGIWLSNVPEYTSVFCIFILIYALLETLSAPMWMTVQATGTIRTYQIIISLVIGLNIFISYIFLKLGFSPVIVLQVKCCLDVIYLAVRLVFMRRKINYLPRIFFKETFMPVLFVVVASTSIMYTTISFTNDNVTRFTASCILWSLTYVPICLYIGMTNSERNKILLFVKQKIKND